MEPSRLENLPFADLYVCLDNHEACYQAFDRPTGQMRMFALPAAYADDISALIKSLETVGKETPNSNTCHQALHLRPTKISDANGQSWVMFQPISKEPRKLEAIGFSSATTNLLQKLGQNHGLILISAGVGQGKTTTSAALLNDYLHRYGGVGCTIDSNEYKLSGRQGAAGLCYQFEVQRKHDWESILENCLQLHARYLLVGELHTSEMACEILRSATSGQLVIANIQAGSLEEGLEELHFLAERSMGNHASALLATALTAIIHQRLTPLGFETRMLTIEHGSMGDAARALIRERRTGQISSLVNQQTAKLK